MSRVIKIKDQPPNIVLFVTDSGFAYRIDSNKLCQNKNPHAKFKKHKNPSR